MWTPKRIALAALAALTIVGVSLSLRGQGGDTEPSADLPTSSGSPGGTVTAGPAGPEVELSDDISDGGGAEPSPLPVAPAQFEQSRDGARAAAIAYLEATETAVTLRPSEAAEWARETASADFADALAADTEARMVELWDTVPAGITLRLAPIETRVVADGEDWEVAVWFVEAITIGSEGVVDDWRTASYRMVWEAGTWKIDAFSSERGPMPGRGTSPASETPAGFEALLTGFDDEGLS